MVREVVDRECIPLESQFLTNDPRLSTTPYVTAEHVDGALPERDWERLTCVVRETGLGTAYHARSTAGSEGL
jgi:hypothetical protein